MPVVPMQKVAVIGHLEVKERVLAYLQRSGTVELSAPPPELEPLEKEHNYEMELLELAAALKLLENVAGKKKNLIETFAPPKEPVTEEVVAQTAKEFDWRAVIARLKDCETQLANIKNLEHTLKAELPLLSPWQKLDVKLSQLSCTVKTCLIAGSCKTRGFERFRKKLGNLSAALHVETVDRDKENTYLLIYHLAAESKAAHDLLATTGFSAAALPRSDNTPVQELAHLHQLLTESVKDKAKLLQEIKSQLKHQRALTLIYEHYYQQQLEQTAHGRLARTTKTFILTGWTPKKDFEKLRAGLHRHTQLADIHTVQPAASELPPTLIENPIIFYPFELITRIFGLPSQQEIDPTGPLSFFYLLFFAMCLSDVGYGIILAAISYYFFKTLTLSEGGKKLLLLLFWGGLATVLAGIITGSYFGLDTGQLPPVLQKLQVIDPIKNPLNVLVLSLALGVFQNLTGLALAMYWKIKNRDYLTAVFDHGLWLYFLTCLVLYVTTAAVRPDQSLLFAVLSLNGAILLAITQGRNEPTLIKKALFGILSLYRTTGYLGDTLSYSRLLALMMTTSIIGMVINIIAGMTRGIPIFGYVIMAAILIIGHAFNLVVSVLGAFIHAARLQLVEFFGKFYENGGREFKPFCRETKYVTIR